MAHLFLWGSRYGPDLKIFAAVVQLGTASYGTFFDHTHYPGLLAQCFAIFS